MNDVLLKNQVRWGPVSIQVTAWAKKLMTKAQIETLEDDLRQFLAHARYGLVMEKYVKIEQGATGVV